MHQVNEGGGSRSLNLPLQLSVFFNLRSVLLLLFTALPHYMKL